jgi:hypothetical protein
MTMPYEFFHQFFPAHVVGFGDVFQRYFAVDGLDDADLGFRFVGHRFDGDIHRPFDLVFLARIF